MKIYVKFFLDILLKMELHTMFYDEDSELVPTLLQLPVCLCFNGIDSDNGKEVIVSPHRHIDPK